MTSLSIINVHERLIDDNYEDFVGEIKAPYYATDVIDIDKTVRWNQEEISKRNKEIAEHNENIFKRKAVGTENFKKDLTEAIANDLFFNYKQAEVIFERAWEDGHEDGFVEVIKNANNLVSVITRIDILKN